MDAACPVVYDFRMPQSSFHDVDAQAAEDWADWEVDLIVVDYFGMLRAELAHKPFNKAAHNRALQQLIPRSRGAIEFKHSNISAVLERLGIPIVSGYKPRDHFQNALIDAIDRYLTEHGAPVFAEVTATPLRLAEPAALWIGPVPLRSRAVAKETPRLRRLVKKFDPGVRDERNRRLGRQGEELTLLHERQRLISFGREDLALKLEWTSEERGDGAGYDIASFELDGRERLIEVKTTNGPARTPFYLSENERTFSEERPDAFRLIRLYNFIAAPAAFELAPPLSDWLKLRPINYRATLSR